MRLLKHTLLLLIGLSVLASCSMDANSEYSAPFVHIMKDGLGQVDIRSNRRDVVSYYIYFSLGKVKQELLVDYKITVGNGLKEGIDYELLTNQNPRSFPPGITKRPIQIRWMDHELDPSEDNTIKIKLISTTPDVNVGLPGPDHKQSEFIIRKVSS